MDTTDGSNFEDVIDSSGQRLIAAIYQIIEQLSPVEKADLAQHLLNTNELTVVVKSHATVSDAIQGMDYDELGNTLESIAEQIKRLNQ